MKINKLFCLIVICFCLLTATRDAAAQWSDHWGNNWNNPISSFIGNMTFFKFSSPRKVRTGSATTGKSSPSQITPVPKLFDASILNFKPGKQEDNPQIVKTFRTLAGTCLKSLLKVDPENARFENNKLVID